MSRRSMLGVPLVALALAGCGSASSSSSSSSVSSSAPAVASATTAAATTAAPATSAFLAPLKTVSTIASTVPANGDVNPYGIVVVPTSTGTLHAGDLLISNFNNKTAGQGTGTTLVQISPSGHRWLFANISASSLPGSCPGGVGLTTALSILPGGYVVVGSLPTTNGMSATAKLGCLIVTDNTGKPVSTISGPNIAGPWDMAASTTGDMTNLFVSNALNGGAAAGKHVDKNSTVVRIALQSGPGQPPKVLSQTVIANQIPWRDDPAALVIGPTGVALAADGTLYVADTLDSRIAAIPQAATRTTALPDGGTTVTQGGFLNQPLGLVLAPNGNILTANAGNGNVVETTPAGHQLLVRTADTKTGAGSLFGLVIVPGGSGVYFVDDGDNTLKVLH